MPRANFTSCEPLRDLSIIWIFVNSLPRERELQFQKLPQNQPCSQPQAVARGAPGARCGVRVPLRRCKGSRGRGVSKGLCALIRALRARGWWSLYPRTSAASGFGYLRGRGRRPRITSWLPLWGADTPAKAQGSSDGVGSARRGKRAAWELPGRGEREEVCPATRLRAGGGAGAVRRVAQREPHHVGL